MPPRHVKTLPSLLELGAMGVATLYSSVMPDQLGDGSNLLGKRILVISPMMLDSPTPL